MRHISTSINVCFGQGSVTEQMQRIYRAGFRAMDINFSDWAELNRDGTYFPYTQKDWEEFLSSIQSFCGEYQVALTQAHGPLFNIFEESARAEHLRAMCRTSLLGAKRLGIPWVVFHAGTAGGDFSSPEHTKKLLETNRRFFDPLVELAEGLGVGIALENMSDHFAPADGGMYCARLDHLLELCDSLKSPRVGICWDTGHAHIQGENQRECLRQIGSRLKVLHLQDNDGRSDQHTAPYYGSICWEDVIGGLKDIHYPGSLTFEAQNLIHRVPDSCKDAALSLLYQIGLSLRERLDS